jgi:hypothetical protein
VVCSTAKGAGELWSAQQGISATARLQSALDNIRSNVGSALHTIRIAYRGNAWRQRWRTEMSTPRLEFNECGSTQRVLTDHFFDKKLLWIFFFVCMIIILLNLVIGIYTPTTVSLNDEIEFFDALWRTASGQHAGIDYHDPVGFGPYQVGALLWRWSGPHDYVMRMSIALFGISVAFCGCLVARRTLTHRIDLALLFCITLAFQLSTPTAYPDSIQFGLMEFYNRLSASALAVLFLHSFGSLSLGPSTSHRYVLIITNVGINLFLLNVLFLTKISAFLFGISLVSVSSLTQAHRPIRLLTLTVTIMILSALIMIEFESFDIDIMSVIRDYELTAVARTRFPINDIITSITNGSLIISVAFLLIMCARQQPGNKGLAHAVIIACYILFQFALNMTNAGPPTIWLAPAAAASLASRMDEKALDWRAFQSLLRSGFNNWRNISAQQLAPIVVFTLVLWRQVLGSALAIGFVASIGLGLRQPYIVTAQRGLSLQVYPGGAYEKSLNTGIEAIIALGLDRAVIANLDYSNPFPFLLSAPSPKGNYVWFGWGYNIADSQSLDWHDIIGDANVVTIPEVPFYPFVTQRLSEILRPKLNDDFDIVYKDASWSIYRLKR